MQNVWVFMIIELTTNFVSFQRLKCRLFCVFVAYFYDSWKRVNSRVRT